MKVWDATTGREALTLEGLSSRFNDAAFQPGRGKRLASAGRDATVKVWDTTTRAQAMLTLKGHIGYVFSVAFSPDAETVGVGRLR